jgi:hypothetical protein
VKFIKDSIPIRTFAKLFTRSGGETVSAESSWAGLRRRGGFRLAQRLFFERPAAVPPADAIRRYRLERISSRKGRMSMRITCGSSGSGMPRSGSGLAAGLLLSLGVLAGPGGSGSSRGQDPAGLRGEWRVVERGLGLDVPLEGIEIRTGDGLRGEMTLIPHGPDHVTKDRPGPAVRLVPARNRSEPARAEWTEGDQAVTLGLWPRSGGRLEAVVLLRDRNRLRAPVGPQRVRQLMLEAAPKAAGNGDPAGPRFDLSGAASETGFVCRVGIDGRDLKLVAAPDTYVRAGYPSWSPDGRQIAFTAFDASGREPLIRLVPADGGSVVAVAAGIAPRWSRDGERIAYIASSQPAFATDWGSIGRNDERIEAVTVAGPKAGTVEVLGRGIWPRWSPVDDRLAFVARSGSSWDLFVRSADGVRFARLTDDLATDLFPSWTPDGREIVFLSDRGNRWDLYRVPADGGGEPRPLLSVRRRTDGPELSPDGQLVAYTDRLGRRDSLIQILDVAAGTIRPLLEGAIGDRDPAWSPDGRSLAFVSRRPVPARPNSP